MQKTKYQKEFHSPFDDRIKSISSEIESHKCRRFQIRFPFGYVSKYSPKRYKINKR